jgi:hypothetical protein
MPLVSVVKLFIAGPLQEFYMNLDGMSTAIAKDWVLIGRLLHILALSLLTLLLLFFVVFSNC